MSAFDIGILQFFENIRSPFLTQFFSFISFLGEGMTVTVAVILIYWLFGRWGEQVAVATLTSFPLNVFLKATVSRPRPYIDGVVSRVEIDNIFVSTTTEALGAYASFPSGHAQISSTLQLSLAMKLKKWWAWVVFPLLVALILACRLYFGVHYPTDVLTGLAIGILISIFWHLVYKRLRGARYYFLAGFAMLAIVPNFFLYSEEFLQASSLLAGLAVFLPFANQIAREPKGLKTLLRIPLGMICIAVVGGIGLFLLPNTPALRTLTYFLVSGGATLGAQALFRLCRV